MKKFKDEKSLFTLPKHTPENKEKLTIALYEARKIIVDDFRNYVPKLTEEDMRKNQRGMFSVNIEGAVKLMNKIISVSSNIADFIENIEISEMFLYILLHTRIQERTEPYLNEDRKSCMKIINTHLDKLNEVKKNSDLYMVTLLKIGRNALEQMTAMYMAGMYSIDGQFKVIKMKYVDYKSINYNAAQYYKKGEYDAETKTIEIYVSADYDYENKFDFQFQADAGRICGCCIIKKEKIDELVEKLKNYNKKTGELI